MKKTTFSIVILIFSTCFVFSQNVDITFRVDMQNQTVSSSGLFVAGTFNNWTTNTNQLTDSNGDQVYEIILSLSANTGYEYKFINGNSWENDLSGSCANNFGSGPNRWLSVGSNDQVELAYQFSSCNVVVFYGCTDSLANNYNSNATNDDGSCDYTVFGCTDLAASNYNPAAVTDDGSCLYAINVTFNVNMSNESISSNGVHIAGSFSGWSTDSIEMNDFDGDGVYTVDILLDQNQSYEYKFINGNSWGDDEILASFENCVNPSSTNRTLTTDANSTQILPTVCFASCIDCIIYGCTDPIALNFDSNATIDDGSCSYSVYGCTDNSSCNYNPSATIDDGSCYNLIFDLGNDTTICSNSFLEIGVPDVYTSYEWNNQEITNSINVSTEGTYVLQISDSTGCTQVDSIHLNINYLPLVDIGNDQTLCPDDSLLLDAGPGWSSYLWSDNSQNQYNLINDTGLVSVQVTDSNGCVGVDIIDIYRKELPTAQFSILINQLDVTFVDESMNSDYYLWDFTSNGVFIDSTVGDVTFNYPNPGSFNATLFVSNECGIDSLSREIILETNEILNNDGSLNIYMNSQNQILIESKNKSNNISMEIFNLNGQILKAYRNEEIISKIINIDFLKTGIYVFIISSDSDKYVKKLFIN